MGYNIMKCGVSFPMLREVPPTKKDGERELNVEGKLYVGPLCMRVSLKGPTRGGRCGQLRRVRAHAHIHNYDPRP